MKAPEDLQDHEKPLFELSSFPRVRCDRCGANTRLVYQSRGRAATHNRATGMKRTEAARLLRTFGSV